MLMSQTKLGGELLPERPSSHHQSSISG